MRFNVILFLMLMLLASCSAQKKLTSTNIHSDFNEVTEGIMHDTLKIDELKRKTTGKTGFYYIINSEGEVVFHPQAVLIGSSFQHFSFIREILKNKSGCLAYRLGDKKIVIFFKKCKDDMILCLSMPADEIEGTACTKKEKKLK